MYTAEIERMKTRQAARHNIPGRHARPLPCLLLLGFGMEQDSMARGRG